MSDPANRSTSAAGGKVYTHPLTGELFDSVTTILDLVDKSALKQWAANLSADFVIENLPQFVTSLLVVECGNTHNRCYQKHGRENRCERCPCGQCLPCWRRRAAYRHSYESSRRSEEGVETHAAIHHWVTTGGQRIEMRPEVVPYFESFLVWVRDYGLHPNGQPGQGDWEQLEITLLNREHMYAGTSDGAVWIRRGRSAAGDHIVDRIGGPNASQVLVRVDYKTREKPDERLFHDMPLQGVAYESCPVAMLPDGREFAPPSTHARAVLQLRPGGAYSFKPMLSDTETFEAFLGVLRAYRWIRGPGKTAFDLDVWAAVPPGVLGTPELADPWADTPPWDDAPAPLPTPTAPYVPAGSPLVTEAEVVRLPEPPQEAPESVPDPFAAHNGPAQVKADTKRPARSRRTTPVTTDATLQSIKDFKVGNPDQTALDEPIPF